MSSFGLLSPILDDNDPALFPKLTNNQLELLARYGKVQPTQVGDVVVRQKYIRWHRFMLKYVHNGDAGRQDAES